jgi:hypothetical protein
MNEKSTKTILARLKPLNPADLAITWAENEVKNSGQDDSNPDVMRLVETYATRCEQFLWVGDLPAVYAEVTRLQRGLRTIANPPRDEIGELAERQSLFLRATREAGWNSIEVELAIAATSGERLGAFEWNRVATSTGRVLDRAELRAKGRPITWTNDITWEAQFPRIERPSELRE